MVKILTTSREILCFSRQGYGWEALGDQQSGMRCCKSHKCCIVRVSLPNVAELTQLGEGNEVKNYILKEPVKTKGCLSIQFPLREFFDS